MARSSRGKNFVTMRDIAKALSISHSTVSLALRDSPKISEAVREKVRLTAEKMGYRPDPMLASLAAYRRGLADRPINASIAWINAWPDPGELRSFREFDAYWNGAKAAAEKFGYRLEEFRLGGENSPARLHQILTTRGVKGLMLPPHHHQPEWEDFPWHEYSLVRFGRTLQSPCCHLVTADQLANTMLAYQEIRRRGYERIGFIGQESELKLSGMVFELGFLGGQRIVGDKRGLPPLLLGDPQKPASAKKLAAWLKKHQPDAIFTTLPGLLPKLEKAGLQVPRDIGLAASTILDTEIDAGIDQHPEEIGRVAFLMLNSQINDGKRGLPKIFRQSLVEGCWVDGSCLPDRTAVTGKKAAKQPGGA